jgi:hypothetical protein
MSTSLLHLRAQNQAKESADRTQEERRRNVLVLMIDYLARNGCACKLLDAPILKAA